LRKQFGLGFLDNVVQEKRLIRFFGVLSSFDFVFVLLS